MKKIFFILFASLSLISCSNDDDFSQKKSSNAPQTKTANKLASGVNVKLYKAWTSLSSKYGRSEYYRKFQVEVRNIDYTKDVAVLHKMSDGSWKFFNLSYLKSTPDGTEIWGGEFMIDNYNQRYPGFLYFADEFAIRYIVKGVEYWDNNNNANYKMGDLEGSYLRSDINISADTYMTSIYSNYGTNDNTFSVHADVRNLNPTKQVSVVYTTDNWATVKTAALQYTSSLTVGAAQTISSPNRFGIERWFAYLNVPSNVNSIEYALSYKVNGVEYWDNNFGTNFIAIKK